jgi:hypothetical protein
MFGMVMEGEHRYGAKIGFLRLKMAIHSLQYILDNHNIYKESMLYIKTG